MPRSEITAMVQRVRGMVEYVRENLTDEELKVFLDEIAPLPEPELPAKKRATKKSAKKSSKSASKSSRASGMAAAIAKSLSHGKSTGEGPICKICSYAEDYEDHSQPSPHYHPFEPSGSAAPPARGRSSTNGGAVEDEQVSAASGD